jgi:hypothetical protein
MPYSNYQVRNTCFKMKKGNVPKFPDIVVEIEKLKGDLSWQDFAETWDIIVKNGQIEVFKTVKDLSMVAEVCGKKNMAVTMGVDPVWTPEEESVIHMIECQFLENKMNWKNYKTVWRVIWNDEQKRVVTDIIKKHFVQNEVTEEQINQQLQAAMTRVKEPDLQPLNFRDMTPEELEKYASLLEGMQLNIKGNTGSINGN